MPNPDFEIYSSCPAGPDEIYKATGWNTYRGTPDYFHTCATVWQFSVPNNNFGYQQSFSGNAYAGFHAYNSSSYREIIGGQLAASLVIGQKYFVSFQVALVVYGQCGCDKIGVKFSTVPFSFSDPVAINNSAHVYSSAIITDTVNWTKVSGSFIADSTYDYIMIGNFFDNANTDTTQITGNPNCGAYFYLENICTSTDSLTCNPDKGESIYEHDNNYSVKVFPNPANEYLFIESRSAIKADEIKLCNLFSQAIEFNFSMVSHNKYLLRFNNPLNGIYILSFNNKKYQPKKIIIHN